MEIETRDRTLLKSYFLKNKIPTESHFAELIDGMLNQQEDGIVKLPNNPLSIEAAGDASSQKKAINFYSSFGDEKPVWSLSLNPRSDPDDPNSARAGFGINDAEGNSRLFIDHDTGNVGIGTPKPQRAIHIRDGVIRVDRSVNTADLLLVRTKADGSVLRCFGVGVEAGESGPDSHNFSIHDFRANVGGHNTKRLVIDSKGNVGIGEKNPSAKLDVNGSLRVGKGTTMTRIVVGRVKSNGSRAGGSGFSSIKTGTGQYTITFDTVFPSVPTIVATCWGDWDNTISVEVSSTRQATVTTYDVDPNNTLSPRQDTSFHFIAIGV